MRQSFLCAGALRIDWKRNIDESCLEFCSGFLVKYNKIKHHHATSLRQKVVYSLYEPIFVGCICWERPVWLSSTIIYYSQPNAVRPKLIWWYRLIILSVDVLCFTRYRFKSSNRVLCHIRLQWNYNWFSIYRLCLTHYYYYDTWIMMCLQWYFFLWIN